MKKNATFKKRSGQILKLILSPSRSFKVFFSTLLFLFWVLATLLLNPYVSATTLLQQYSDSFVSGKLNQEIYAKQKVVGVITTNTSNLGTIQVRFHTFNRINSDYVLFRLKEKGTDRWFYENKYKVDQFQPDEFFPFGFPIISNSQGKTYEFEIESTKGRKKDAVAISNISPNTEAKYQFSKADIQTSPVVFSQFLLKKIITNFTTGAVLSSSIIYLFPFLFYLMWVFLTSYVLKEYSLVFVTLLLVLLDVVFVPFVLNSYLILLIIAFWLFASFRYHFESSVSFFGSAICLSFSAVFLLIGQPEMAERSAIWVYLFFISGIFLFLIEIFFRRKNMQGYEKITHEFSTKSPLLQKFRKTLKR